jgi:hypothetical protein
MNWNNNESIEHINRVNLARRFDQRSPEASQNTCLHSHRRVLDGNCLFKPIRYKLARSRTKVSASTVGSDQTMIVHVFQTATSMWTSKAWVCLSVLEIAGSFHNALLDVSQFMLQILFVHDHLIFALFIHKVEEETVVCPETDEGSKWSFTFHNHTLAHIFRQQFHSAIRETAHIPLSELSHSRHQ